MRELAKDQSRKAAIEKALQRIERQSSEPVETPKPGETSKPVETPKPGDTAGSEETSGGSEDNTGNLPGDSSAGVSAGDRKNNYMTLVVRMADAEGNPAADLTVEIHSTPKTVRTSQNGIAVFAEVEEGRHTLYVQDEEGNVLASKAFEIIFGEKISLRGNQLLVRRGSACTLNVQFDGTELTFLSQQEGDVYHAVSPGTGDSAKILLWFLLAFSSCSVLAGIWFYGRKKKS